jgi:hypothetical protein
MRLHILRIIQACRRHNASSKLATRDGHDKIFDAYPKKEWPTNVTGHKIRTAWGAARRDRSVSIDRLLRLFSAWIGLELTFDLSRFIPHLQEVPSKPESDADDHEKNLGALEGVDRADIFQVDGPTGHSIGRHCFVPSSVT